MIKMNRRSVLKTSAAGIGAAAVLPELGLAQAGFTPPANNPEALKGTEFTPFGSVRAGNADGSIPAWTGGYSVVPEGYKQGDPRPIPPILMDKALFSITSANVDQYRDKLPAAIVALFLKHPDYRMDIYPTHRTAVAPQYVYDYIYKNAQNAVLSSDGQSVTGAYGGIPFPFPQNGNEVMWNHLLAWAGTTVYFWADAYAVPTSGQRVLETRAEVWFQYPYYFENGESRFKGFTIEQYIVPRSPPYTAGAAIVNLAPLNPSIMPVEAWEYLVGQRRVRRAPELQYDTPNSLAGGVTNWDEANIFSGKLNEYNFEYVGDKEMYIPYNSNKAWAATADQQMGPHFFNPDFVRWELHRVRVVEMTLKPGARNVDARRTIYMDEDTGSAVACDIYDESGSIWKLIHNTPVLLPDVPCVLSNSSFITYDLHVGDYAIGDFPNAATQPQWKIIPELPSSFFTPGQLAASSGGF